MGEFVLSCCSTADLTAEHLKARNIEYIPFHFYLDGVEYTDDLGESISPDRFYDEMKAGKMTRTSQVNADEFEVYFEKFLKEGKDIIHISLSSGISGVYNSANIAKEVLLQKYFDRKIYIIDSLTASVGYGLLMDRLADLRDAGKSVVEVARFAKDYRGSMNGYFLSTDLTYYVRGGRISKTSGALGGLLNICPLLYINRDGKLIIKEKVRTKKKAVKRIIDIMEEQAENGEKYAEKCFVSMSACEDDANEVARLIEARFPHLKEKVRVNSIGPTIGSHTGPGTIAVFFWGKERTL